MKHRGLFISFEGAEGVGKSTQLSLLEAKLKSENYKVYRTREPGGTPLGDELRRLFKTNEMGALTELFMVEASRAEHVESVLAPRLKSGEIILCDRYAESSLVYQGILRKIPLEKVRLLNRLATKGLTPDLCIWLDLDPKRVAERLKTRAGNGDRFDHSPESFHKAIAAAYRKIAKSSRKPKLTRFDAALDEESLHEKIFSVVKTLIRKKRL